VFKTGANWIRARLRFQSLLVGTQRRRQRKAALASIECAIPLQPSIFLQLRILDVRKSEAITGIARIPTLYQTQGDCMKK
jgi:hypothetical protein